MSIDGGRSALSDPPIAQDDWSTKLAKAIVTRFNLPVDIKLLSDFINGFVTKG